MPIGIAVFLANNLTANPFSFNSQNFYVNIDSTQAGHEIPMFVCTCTERQIQTQEHVGVRLDWISSLSLYIYIDLLKLK